MAIESEKPFSIIKSEHGIVDVEFICYRDKEHMCSMTWCEENCIRHTSCDQIAEANDFLVESGY